MALDPIAELLKRITRSREWPLKSEAATWRRVLAWRAFLDSDRDALKVVADWQYTDREYKVDPLGERIADAWADHLFSEDLEVTPSADADAARLDELVAGNELTNEFRAAERDYVASEGEGWWRWVVDRDVATYPLLEWHSRASIVPFYIGKRLLACALITILEGSANLQSSRNARFRHFEFHADGVVEHHVFRGTDQRLGAEVPLDAHPETEELMGNLDDLARWNHGLPMLMGRIINKRGRDPRLGVSEYNAIKDYLLELNEALTIGGENMRLTAKKRVVVSETALDARGDRRPTGDDLIDVGDGSFVRRDGTPQFNAGEDVIVSDALNEELGKDGAGVFKVLEYSFDAAALIAHKRDLVETALTRLGITPQWVGIVAGDSAGLALTGTALRLRLIPTTKAGHGKGKEWDTHGPEILRRGALLDELPDVDGGFGTPWTNTIDPPGIERANPLPADELEDATIESTLVNAGVRSIETSIRAQHPEWEDDAVLAERDAILRDKRDLGGVAVAGFGGPPPAAP